MATHKEILDGQEVDFIKMVWPKLKRYETRSPTPAAAHARG